MPPRQKYPVNCPRNTMLEYSWAWVERNWGGKKKKKEKWYLWLALMDRGPAWTATDWEARHHRLNLLIYRPHYFLPSSATKNTVTRKIKPKKQFIFYPILLTERFQTAKLPISILKTKAKVALKQLAWAHLLPDNTSKPPSPTLQPSEPSLPWTVPRNRLQMQCNWIYCFCNPGNPSYRGDVTFRFANANLIPF